MNNLALFCLVVKIEKERGGTCRDGVLITEERSRLGASPGVEQQKGQAVLEGLYSPGDQRGTARPRTGNRLYLSKNESQGRDKDIHSDNTVRQGRNSKMNEI